MCDIPGHPQGDATHNLLHSMDEKMDTISNNQAELMSDMYGRENKDGLLKKVDDIREGRVTGVRRESAGMAAVTSMMVAAMYAVLATFGIVPGGQQ